MKWTTRARPKTDRIACPWLIRRFIDPDAEILFVPADQVLTVAAAHGGNSFDAPGARYTHQPTPDGAGERCTFETLIAAHDLGGVGGLDAEPDDQALLESGMFVYDALSLVRPTGCEHSRLTARRLVRANSWARPGKSGVGGGILAVIPNRCTICVWSPALSPSGNSTAGLAALDAFTTRTGWSIF